jgi:glutamine cyclotransferase
VDLETGAVLQSVSLPSQFFGEGITVFGDEIIQLTWQSGVGFVYERESLRRTGQFGYATEGWGITHDGQHLIMSDGSSTLRFLHPKTFDEVSRLLVFDHEGPVSQLNELEYVRGQIYANVWKTDRVALIDPTTGEVRAWIDLEGILGTEEPAQPVDVLNGIAFDAVENRLLVTGKLWPKLFQIDLECPRASRLFLPLVGN